MGVVTVERTIHAEPAAVWSMVADVERMGEWSPETASCRWLGGARGPAVGARFRGENRIGWRRWWTTCTVVECDEGESFAFDVTVGPIAVARWAYRFAPVEGGTRVRESFTERRHAVVRQASALISGVHDREAHNRASMEATLDRLAAAAESRV